MDKPTEWTYGGLLDWSSADKLRLTPRDMGLYCIVEVLKERATAVNYTLQAILTDDYNPLKIGYCAAIEEAITALIPRFVNHTDLSGDWSGLADAADVAPGWTVADLMAAIESESRIMIQKLAPISAEWAHQQYQILNMLRWVRNSTRLVGSNFYYRKLGDGPAAEAIPEYNSAAWVDASGYSWGASRSVGWFNDPDYNYRSETIVRVKRKYRHTQTGTIGNSYDFYVYTEPYSFMTESTFNNQGSNVVENAYSKLTTTAELTETADFYVLDEDSVPPNCPPWIYPETPYNKTWGWQVSGVISVAKFDGLNGFKFRDW